MAVTIATGKRGNPAQPARGVNAATVGTRRLGIGLAHGTEFIKRLFTVRAVVFVNGHIRTPRQNNPIHPTGPILLGFAPVVKINSRPTICTDLPAGLQCWRRML